jgi:uncharacterized Fe-S cluster protein YjdI
MDPVIIKRYATDDVTVIWQPHTCSHSGICFRGLPGVFDPRRRPWVDVTAADTAAIVAQVDQCPSGALSWTPTTPHAASAPSDAPVAVAPAGAGVIVEPLPNGPLVVHGTVTVRAADGSDTTRERRTAFCRCGQSSNKPYCDGSHAAAGFTG